MKADKIIEGIVIGLVIGLMWDVGNKVAPNYFQ